jgi:type II secretory pathway component PulF
MPYYRCTVCNAAGKKQDLLVQAGNTAELLEAWAGNNDFLLSYTEADDTAIRDTGFGKKRQRFSRELVREFTGIMAALLASGNTIASSLELCGSVGGSSRGKLARLCTLLLDGIRKGEGFSSCLLRASPCFSALYVALIGIGEKTGSTAEVFKRLAGYLATSKKIRTKVEGTLFYPVFVLVCALAGSVLVLIFVMPRMAEIFSAFGTGENTVDMSGMYTSLYTLLSVLFCAGIGFCTAAVLRRHVARVAVAVDAVVLKLPFVGPFLTALESLDFCFALELCSRSGMNIALSLGEAQRILRNRYYAGAVGNVLETVRAGGNLSAAFLAERAFPTVIGQWIAVGERTGEAEMVFAHLKDFFTETVDSFTERFLSSLEPVLMLLTGLIVLFLVLQFVLPLFSLYGAVL